MVELDSYIFLQIVIIYIKPRSNAVESFIFIVITFTLSKDYINSIKFLL